MERLGRIGVLMGGPSSEREISLKSGQAVYEALRGCGIEAVAVDIKTDSRDDNIDLIKPMRLDCAFLALHGRFGEDGKIQQILEELNLPYTCSGVASSSLAMDKIASLEIFRKGGLNIPRYHHRVRLSSENSKDLIRELGLPLVIKPATHGSSIGLSIIRAEKDFKKALDLAFDFDRRVVIEEYIRGRELTVGVLDDEVLPVIEIIPKNEFFDYQAKYQPGMTEYILPARLEEKIAQQTQEAALAAHKLLGCWGCSRTDMILDKDNKIFVLELNTIPGFTSTSLLPKAAKSIGIEFSQLCVKLIKLAYEKQKS